MSFGTRLRSKTMKLVVTGVGVGAGAGVGVGVGTGTGTGVGVGIGIGVGIEGLIIGGLVTGGCDTKLPPVEIIFPPKFSANLTILSAKPTLIRGLGTRLFFTDPFS
jgi:hypothetical protein